MYLTSRPSVGQKLGLQQEREQLFSWRLRLLLSLCCRWIRVFTSSWAAPQAAGVQELGERLWQQDPHCHCSMGEHLASSERGHQRRESWK